jgi:hypothetical protein
LADGGQGKMLGGQANEVRAIPLNSSRRMYDPLNVWDVSTPVIENSEPNSSATGRKLRHYRKAPAKAIAAARERPASENQCERIRKLISRSHRDELEAERKAARRKCATASTRLLDIFHDRGILRTLRDALERGGRRRSRRNRRLASNWHRVIDQA